MLNQVVLEGRLAKDPEVSVTQSGVTVQRFTLVSDDGVGDKKKTYFFEVTRFYRQGSQVTPLQKGRLIAVVGRLEWRSWTGQDGTNREKVSIVASTFEYLSKRPEEQGQAMTPSQAAIQAQAPAKPIAKVPSSIDVPDEDLPF